MRGKVGREVTDEKQILSTDVVNYQVAEEELCLNYIIYIIKQELHIYRPHLVEELVMLFLYIYMSVGPT